MVGEQLSPLQEYPDLDSLTYGLQTSLGLRNGLRVLRRQPTRRPHTFPSEVVNCRLDDGRELNLFCKYQKGDGHPSHGHRGGLAREAAVYRHILALSSSSAPHFYGSYRLEDSGETWLLIEYMEGCQRVLDTTAPPERGGAPQVGAMPLAAGWLGRFHAEHEMKSDLGVEGLLMRYDLEYYNSWARRAAVIANSPTVSLPWVDIVSRGAAQAMSVLPKEPFTLVHGEFYPGNVLVRDGVIYPVDWESAAIAAGEIDLAALIENWPAEIATRCRDAYVAARFPRGEPRDFERRLNVARLYLHFRWLGEWNDWTTHKRVVWRLGDLQALCVQLGLLPAGSWPAHQVPTWVADGGSR
jgi:aminoglycoside phosphotransferase (APT) family kinase protein